MEPNATRSGTTEWLDERYRQVIEQVEDYARHCHINFV